MKTLHALKDGNRIHLSHSFADLVDFRDQERIHHRVEVVHPANMHLLPIMQQDGFTFACFPDVDAQALGLRVVDPCPLCGAPRNRATSGCEGCGADAAAVAAARADAEALGSCKHCGDPLYTEGTERCSVCVRAQLYQTE